ncbi:MAG TPA: hypothetical protein VNZ52_11225, partial [Candidatus Thermoplasmatota archaeon]|nr:hypothetical protein [Candidatus Thermoplasmatota archaeon]
PLTAEVEVHALAGSLPQVPGQESALPEASTPGAAGKVLGLRASKTGLAFGELEPGQTSERVSLDIENTGTVPFRLDVVAGALAGPFGSAIPADRILVSASETGPAASLGGTDAVAGLPSIAPGGKLTLYFTLTVPKGSEAYVPAGPYNGAFSFKAVEVTA